MVQVCMGQMFFLSLNQQCSTIRNLCTVLFLFYVLGILYFVTYCTLFICLCAYFGVHFSGVFFQFFIRNCYCLIYLHGCQWVFWLQLWWKLLDDYACSLWLMLTLFSYNLMCRLFLEVCAVLVCLQSHCCLAMLWTFASCRSCFSFSFCNH